MEFKHLRGSGYRCIAEDENAKILRKLRNDWKRHPELRRQYGGSYQRYLRSIQNEVTFF